MAKREPLGYVNPLWATDSTMTFSHGNALPLVALPWGMNHWSVQNSVEREGWFFHPSDRMFQGIRCTHQPSPWAGDYGHFTLMPQSGKLFVQPMWRASSFRPDKTNYHPHLFTTTLERYAIKMAFSVTDRCSIMELEFKGKEDARLILDTFTGDSSIILDPERREISGFTSANSGGVPSNFRHFFLLQFDCAIDAPHSGVFQKGDVKGSALALSGEQVGAYVGFRLPENLKVTVRIATSFISLEQARLNLEKEIGTSTFKEVVERAKAVWNENLSRISITTEDGRKLEVFYSAMYRFLLFPRAFHEFGKEGNMLHYSPYDGNVHEGPLYADNGFWDTHRTVFPLLSIVFPKKLQEILTGWINTYKEGGWYPKWSSPGYRPMMIATHIDAVLADAYVKGLLPDAETAYEGMRKNAFVRGADDNSRGRLRLDLYLEKGYVPHDQVKESASRTMDFAYCDFCVAQVAKGLGKEEDYSVLMQRSGNYRNLFDRETGFMRGKNGDGSWGTPFDSFDWGGPFVEGSAWQCGLAVQHDIPGLVELHGGKERFIKRLDDTLSTPPYFHTGSYGFEIHEMTEMAAVDFGQYAHSNQPSHHILYLYAAVGEAAKTQYWVRKVMDELYQPGPAGLPGDEDNGEMSAWYILSSMGIYPLCPGRPEYVLGSPQFAKMEILTDEGKRIMIDAKNQSEKNVYVQRVTVDGRECRDSRLEHEVFRRGGRIEFRMNRKSR